MLGNGTERLWECKEEGTEINSIFVLSLKCPMFTWQSNLTQQYHNRRESRWSNVIDVQFILGTDFQGNFSLEKVSNLFIWSLMTFSL